MEEYMLTRVDGIEASQHFIGKNAKTGIAVDEKNKKIMLVDKNINGFITRIISYRDVLSSEIIEDGVSIIKTERASQLGGALVGGILFGGLGAVVGGLSGAKTSGTDKVRKIELHIIVNDTQKPLHVISFLEKEVRKTGFAKYEYDQASDSVRHWHSLLNVLIKKADNKLDNSLIGVEKWNI